MPTLADLVKVRNPEAVPMGTGLANKAKETLKNRKAYQQWVLEDPENRSQVSFEEWRSGDTDD